MVTLTRRGPHPTNTHLYDLYGSIWSILLPVFWWKWSRWVIAKWPCVTMCRVIKVLNMFHKLIHKCRQIFYIWNMCKMGPTGFLNGILKPVQVAENKWVTGIYSPLSLCYCWWLKSGVHQLRLVVEIPWFSWVLCIQTVVVSDFWTINRITLLGHNPGPSCGILSGRGIVIAAVGSTMGVARGISQPRHRFSPPKRRFGMTGPPKNIA